MKVIDILGDERQVTLQTNRLHTFLGVDVEKVAEPAAEPDERLEVMTVPQAQWHSDEAIVIEVDHDDFGRRIELCCQ
jgi:hypothetical protein